MSSQDQTSADAHELESVGAAESALMLMPLGLACWFYSFLAAVSAGETHRLSLPWVPSLDVRLSFQLDGLSLLFSLLITGIGTLVFAYAPGYFSGNKDRWRLYSWLLLFMIAMLGVVLADNVLTMFVFWELTSITSYMLIGFRHEDETSRAAALQALLTTGLGGLAMLAGLLLLGQAGGTYELSSLLQHSESLRNDPLATPAVLLILLGAFTKSAQFPFHFWLPNAMTAPTPVSAYLHSATMVKAGVYLVARLSPIFSGLAVWDVPLLAVGAITAAIGAWLALRQVDMKRILAYSTVSVLGTLMMLLGMGTATAIKAAIVLLLCHSLYKASLFLIAGAVDHCTGTRDVRRLHGLGRSMPWLAFGAALAGLSQAGVPPAAGFLAKELIYETLLSQPTWRVAVLAVGFFVNVSFVAVSGTLAMGPFFGKPEPSLVGTAAASVAHRPTVRLFLPPVLLAAFGIFLGLSPSFAGKLTVPAVLAVAPGTETFYLKLWHGLNGPLAMSMLTVVVGLVAYVARRSLRGFGARFNQVARFGPTAGYNAAIRGLKAVAAGQTALLQNGRLRTYLLIVVSSFTALIGWMLFDRVEFPTGSGWLNIEPHEAFLPGIILAAAVMAVLVTSRLAAVCAVGVIGYAVAMLYVLFGAPDLAMTQLVIETLTVVVFVFVIYKLPRFARISSASSRLRDAAIAIAGGCVMSAVVLAATAAHAPSRLSPYFVEHSYTAAKGKNIVNVILVDFRGLDTLGEITVLAAAALGIFTLMRVRVEAEGKSDGETSPSNDSLPADDSVSRSMAPIRRGVPDRSFILSTATRYLLPLLLMFSVFLLFRGHNEPGGGFVGGLVAAAAFSLFSIAAGVAEARRMLRVQPRLLLGVGLAMAASAGLAGVTAGLPYMTGIWTAIELPAIGKVGSPVFFDVGVYFVVVGTALMVVFELAEN